MKRSIAFILVSCLLLSAVSAIDLTTSLGMRQSTVGKNPVVVSLEVEEGKDYFSVAYMDRMNFLLSYDHSFPMSGNWYLKSGAAANAIDFYTYALLEDFSVGYTTDWGWGHCDLSVGEQVGVAKFKSLDPFFWSLSPLTTLSLGLRFLNVDLTGYVDMKHRIERTWKTTFNLGAKLETPLGEGYRFGVEGWGRAAEYLMDHWIMVDSMAVTVYLTKRGI